jgi:hypothetical protein
MAEPHVHWVNMTNDTEQSKQYIMAAQIQAGPMGTPDQRKARKKDMKGSGRLRIIHKKEGTWNETQKQHTIYSLPLPYQMIDIMYQHDSEERSYNSAK